MLPVAPALRAGPVPANASSAPHAAGGQHPHPTQQVASIYTPSCRWPAAMHAAPRPAPCVHRPRAHAAEEAGPAHDAPLATKAWTPSPHVEWQMTIAGARRSAPEARLSRRRSRARSSGSSFSTACGATRTGAITGVLSARSPQAALKPPQAVAPPSTCRQAAAWVATATPPPPQPGAPGDCPLMSGCRWPPPASP